MAKQNEPFKLWQKKLMQEPTPTFGEAIGQQKEEVIVDETPKEAIVDVKEQKPKIDPNKFLGGVFDERPKAPVYNTSEEARNQAMMKAQAIGNLLALVGDVGGVLTGANVARREMKPLEPYMAAIQRKREQFEKDKRAFDKEDWLARLKEAEAKSAAESAAKETAYKKEQDAKKEEFQEKKFKTDIGFKKAAAKLAEDKAKESVRQFDEELAYKKAKDAAANAIKESTAKGKATKDLVKVVVNVDGKEIGFKEGEKGKYLDEALDWIKDNGKTLTDMDYAFEIQPDLANEQLVRRYIAEKAKSDPIFKEFLLQKDDGINDYEEYRKKIIGDEGIKKYSEDSTDKWSKYVRK
jgi:hypothetical protein